MANEHIGEVLTQADLQGIAANSAKNFSQLQYVAPTVYRPAGGVGTWNYYNKLQDALNKYNGKTVTPAGTISFSGTGAVTMGINVDFFGVLPVIGVIPMPYASVKELMYSTRKLPGGIIRFYKTDGTGPYYSVFSPVYLAATAIQLKNVPADKLAALNELHGQLQLAKAKYNFLASYLADLSKKTLSPKEQQIFNEGLLTLNNYERQLRAVPGVDLVFNNDGKISGIGIVPIVWVAIILVSALVVAYSLDKITGLIKSVKAINAAYDMQKFVAEQKQKLAADVKAGKITKADAVKLNADLDKAGQAAAANAETASAPDKNIFDQLQSLLLIGGSIFLISKVAN